MMMNDDEYQSVMNTKKFD